MPWIASSPPTPRMAGPGDFFCFVASYAQDGGPEDLLRLRVGDHLHEALGFALLYGAPDPRHRTLRHEQRPARLARLGFGEPAAPKGRVDIESIGGNPVAHPPRRAVEDIRADNLEIVVGR